MQKLLDIMATLRDPVRGCPWDREQDFRSIAPYTIEEAYEVADAIDRADLADLRDELGDLLLQVVFHARMAEEQQAFAFADVVTGICDKLVRRHPHVFGDLRIETATEQSRVWEAYKAAEQDRGPAGRERILAGVGRALPALMRAAKLGKRAARVGFDWSDVAGVKAKLHEELEELERAQRAGDTDGIAEEIGDLLFTTANLARRLEVDPEEALRRANRKFEQRFDHVEGQVRASGRAWDKFTPPQLDALWVAAKDATYPGPRP
jgi:MazG family protein